MTDLRKKHFILLGDGRVLSRREQKVDLQERKSLLDLCCSLLLDLQMKRSIQRILKYPLSRTLTGDDRQLVWKFHWRWCSGFWRELYWHLSVENQGIYQEIKDYEYKDAIQALVLYGHGWNDWCLRCIQSFLRFCENEEIQKILVWGNLKICFWSILCWCMQASHAVRGWIRWRLLYQRELGFYFSDVCPAPHLQVDFQ